MLESLLFLLIVLPFLAGLAIRLAPGGALRSGLVAATVVLTAACSLSLLGHGEFAAHPGDLLGFIPVRGLIALADFALLFLILYYAFKLDSLLIKLLTAFQVIMLAVLEFGMVDHGAKFPTFFADNLSLIMVLVISLVGGLICIYALPYMREHEKHLGLKQTRQPRFFMFLILFLGAMNGLVLANDLTFFYFFFEVTTLCSFLLIAHDDTDEAWASAKRALLLNGVGGAAFVLAMVWSYAAAGTLSIQALVTSGSMAGAMLVPMAFFCLAGFTKAAQMPFQSWLLGAMVAPTPTSALLHSSTMVKAGVYLVLRFAPAFAGTFLSDSVAVIGAFTFVAAAALAVGQSNAKKILAYSTISNLGLIIACAGINTPQAITAGVLLLIFHAASKGLLFCCVGHIEQHIHSRDIEDMRGLSAAMPRAAMITIIGILTMMLPPFGVLLSKWMAIEAAAGNLVVIVLLALGSALTVFIYARWAGNLMSAPYKAKPMPSTLGFANGLSLVLLAGGAVVLSLLAPVLYTNLVLPDLTATPYQVVGGTLDSPVGAFAVYPLFLALGIAFLIGLRAVLKARSRELSPPYMSGVQLDDSSGFKGPMGLPVKMSAGNYYLASVFGEDRLTFWINIGAAMLLALMIGGAL
ncbi:NADH-quinone oxidoreductase subunit L [Desulfohalovibrio reitneri]|uniref:NADH-quinone oxidoreductase subunit 5 family protein n=1 Tax=Desulfohalovibrio reitneri TaxID=1307759 RepID=UPI0004A6B89B|nr:proton-conducting transporter membrane subunit [Desulfohalovibrio reitneri]